MSNAIGILPLKSIYYVFHEISTYRFFRGGGFSALTTPYRVNQSPELRLGFLFDSLPNPFRARYPESGYLFSFASGLLWIDLF